MSTSFETFFHILRSAFFPNIYQIFAVHSKPDHMQLLIVLHIVLHILKSQHTVYGVASIFYLVAVITQLRDVQKVQHSVGWPTKTGFYFVQSCKKDKKKKATYGRNQNNMQSEL